jgi:hypothetical protein
LKNGWLYSFHFNRTTDPACGDTFIATQRPGCWRCRIGFSLYRPLLLPPPRGFVGASPLRTLLIVTTLIAVGLGLVTAYPRLRCDYESMAGGFNFSGVMQHVKLEWYLPPWNDEPHSKR